MMIVQEVKQKAIDVLETFCPNNVYLQGTLNPDVEYPQKFITFFISTTELDAFYDDDSNTVGFYLIVMFYSDDPTEVATIPQEIWLAMKSEGFIPDGIGNDIISDVESHTGWAMDFKYIVNLMEKE